MVGGLAVGRAVRPAVADSGAMVPSVPSVPLAPSVPSMPSIPLAPLGPLGRWPRWCRGFRSSQCRPFRPRHPRLNRGEREVMQRHAQIGHDILAYSGSPLLDLAAEIAVTHHEHFDGNGYPAGLPGEKILLAGRIVAIVDVFDALISDRPYRARLPLERTLEIMHAGSGTHFDPALLDCFIEHVDEALEVPGVEVNSQR